MTRQFPRTEILIPDDLRVRLIENGRTAEVQDGLDPFPAVKLFTPDAAATWLISPITAMLVACAMIVVMAAPASAEPPPDRPPAIATSSDPWAAHITEAARRFDIPERWIRAVMAVESIGDPAALSPKGAIGLMQVMPATWDELRAKHGFGDDPWHPRDNILAGAAYLREMHDRYGAVDAMLAAYNAGPGRYDEHLASGRALPAETVD